MKKKLTMVVVVAAGLLLAGCSGGPGIEKDATYESAAALKDAMVASGYDCPSWDDSDTTEDFDAGRCLTDHRDFIRVYESVEAREADLDDIILGTQMGMVAARINMGLLVGPNWTVAAPAEAIPGLRDQLGGFEPDLSDVRMPV